MLRSQKSFGTTKHPLGFLPFTNLKRLSIVSSLKFNWAMSESEFDQVKIHEAVQKSTNLYNFRVLYFTVNTSPVSYIDTAV